MMNVNKIEIINSNGEKILSLEKVDGVIECSCSSDLRIFLDGVEMAKEPEIRNKREFLEIRKLKGMFDREEIPYEYKELDDGGMIIYYPSKEECTCEIESSESSYGGKFDTLQITASHDFRKLCGDDKYFQGLNVHKNGWLDAAYVFKKVFINHSILHDTEGEYYE